MFEVIITQVDGDHEECKMFESYSERESFIEGFYLHMRLNSNHDYIVMRAEDLELYEGE